MRLAMIVEYDGAGYSGFQYQRNAPTVQEQIEKAIESLTGEPVRIKAAGRTDAGVHAQGQVVAFDTQMGRGPEILHRALNAGLPEDIAIRSVYEVRPDFDPRRDAVSRLYRYTLLVSKVRSPLARRTAYRVAGPLDLKAMRRAASAMEGLHDFANFGGQQENSDATTTRRINSVELAADGCEVAVDVNGSAFLPHQVRRMVGALVDVGKGRLNVDHVERQIAARRDAPTARAVPPHGLCLMEVNYRDFPQEEGEQET